MKQHAQSIAFLCTLNCNPQSPQRNRHWVPYQIPTKHLEELRQNEVRQLDIQLDNRAKIYELQA